MEWPGRLDIDTIDTKIVAPRSSGIKVLFKIDPTIGGTKCFRAYGPFRYFPFDLSRDRTQFWAENNLLFDNLVGQPWGLLALLGIEGYVPRMEFDEVRSRLFFESLVENWEIFLEERHLFEQEDWQSPTPVYFWNGAHNRLWNALRDCGGVPSEILNSVPLHERDDYQAVRWINEYILK